MLNLGTHLRGRAELADRPANPSAVGAPGRVALPIGQASVTLALRITVEALIVGTFAAQLMKANGVGLGIARFIDADVKVNLPTGFKVFSLATAALLAWAIGRTAHAADDGGARRWTQMAAVLAFLTVDEMAYVHQSLAAWTGERSGILHYSWVIVYLPAAMVIGVLFLPFVASLRRDLRTNLVLAGLLFGGGSGGVELVKAKMVHGAGEESLAFYLTTAVSDSLEMIGLAVLVVALLGELRRRAGSVELRFER
jgi:hypothetical protein